jgi:hypothetical protein
VSNPCNGKNHATIWRVARDTVPIVKRKLSALSGTEHLLHLAAIPEPKDAELLRAPERYDPRDNIAE